MAGRFFTRSQTNLVASSCWSRISGRHIFYSPDHSRWLARRTIFPLNYHPRRQSWLDPVGLWMIGAIMTHDAAVLKAREIASRVLAPSAGQNDKAGRFSTQAVVSLGESGLLGLLLPVDFGGSGLGPPTVAVVAAALADADAFSALGFLIPLVRT